MWVLLRLYLLNFKCSHFSLLCSDKIFLISFVSLVCRIGINLLMSFLVSSFVCVSVYLYAHINTCVWVCLRLCLSLCMCVYVCVYVSVCTLIWECVWVHVCMCIYTEGETEAVQEKGKDPPAMLWCCFVSSESIRYFQVYLFSKKCL